MPQNIRLPDAPHRQGVDRRDGRVAHVDEVFAARRIARQLPLRHRQQHRPRRGLHVERTEQKGRVHQHGRYVVVPNGVEHGLRSGHFAVHVIEAVALAIIRRFLVAGLLH